MSTTLSAPVLLKKPLSNRDRHFADRFSFGYNKALEAGCRIARAFAARMR